MSNVNVSFAQFLSQFSSLEEAIAAVSPQGHTAAPVEESRTCKAKTRLGLPCKNPAKLDSSFCWLHNNEVADKVKPLDEVETDPCIDGRDSYAVKVALASGRDFSWHSATTKLLKANLREFGTLTYTHHAAGAAHYVLETAKYGNFAVIAARRQGANDPDRLVSQI